MANSLAPRAVSTAGRQPWDTAPMGPAADAPVLLAAAKAGDRAALGELMERFRLYLLKAVADDVPPGVRAKVPPSDVVQDAMLEAYKLFERFDGAGADEFKGWLAGILHNKAREAVRRFHGTAMRDAGREVGLSGAGAAGGPTPSGQAVKREQAEAVLAAIGRLPDEYQQVIRLRTWDGLAFADVAARTGRTEGAARMLFARAMKRLEQELEHEPG